jgi:hypothetical protein
MPPEAIAAVKQLNDSLEVALPSLYMIPNVAQYRALEAMYPKSGKMPDWTSVEFANGVGKSALLILDMVGWTMGSDFLCAEAYPPSAIRFYDSLQPLRDSGRMSMRLCCVSDDMKAGGSVYELLHDIFPWAKVTAPDTSKCFRQIDIIHPTIRGITNHIAVKTFDQDEQKHSGSTCKRIWINEQLYDSLFGETIGRIRSKGGTVDGTIAEFATRLDRSTLHDNLETAGHFTLKRCPGHLYENCQGEEVTDEMAYEVLTEIGIQMQKNPDGPGYLTNGVLKKEKIMAMIEGWLRTCPHQLEARKCGKPISTGGKIWPTFLQDVHVISDDTYDPESLKYPMAQVVDPHPARPDACIWAMILPSDRIVIVDEWPTVNEFGYFDQIKENRFTVNEKCDIWRRHEAAFGYTPMIGQNRIGDPNRFLEPNPDNHGNLSMLYQAQGFNFNLNINDDFEFGIELVSEYLWYDQNLRRLHPEDPSAQPRLVICKKCENTYRAVANFSRKVNEDPNKPVSEDVEKRYECFAACVRYLIVWHRNHHFEDIRPNANRISDYDKIKMGRIPKSFRGAIGGMQVDLKGRSLYRMK